MENFTLKQFGNKVYEYCGLNYLDNLTSLEAKVNKRLNELQCTLWEYMKHLDNHPEEWDRTVELLTINETYFYREDLQLKEMQTKILPNLKQEKRVRPIRIWSAACSTGEEPYTLAMLIIETGLFQQGDIEIIATDIDKAVLATAKKGFYSKKSLSFRRIPQTLLEKYFIEQANGYQICQEVQRMVQFSYLNLLDNCGMNQMAQFDIIFCRNVLIYFDQSTIRKVVTSFYKSLCLGGYLFLGHSENISTMGIGFQTVNGQNTFYYRKAVPNG